IRVATPTRLYANPYLIGAGVQKWFTYFQELSRSWDFYRFVGCVHIHPLSSELFQVMADVDLPPFATSACDSNRTHSQNTHVRGLWAKHRLSERSALATDLRSSWRSVDSTPRTWRRSSDRSNFILALGRRKIVPRCPP